MKIDVVGRNLEVSDDLHELAHERFGRLSRQVSELAQLDLVLREEQNPAISACCVAEATLHVKGKTLHAEEAETDMEAAIRHVAKDIRRQVKRHRELQRKRSTTRRMVGRMRGREA